MTFLHKNVIHSLITEELETLKARGNSHRDVLENSFNPSTLQHIVLMELHTDTEVVITDKNGEVLLSSKQVDIYMKKIIEQPFSQTSRNGLIVQSEWDKERYIATVTPFKTDDSKSGYVYMFENTENIKALVSKLNGHFVLAFIVLFFFMLMTIFFLSRALTKPLILMKESTTKLSKGDFSVSIPIHSQDELGELAQSIQRLAHDLSFVRKERNEFLSSISHELRTPLTYIKGYADIAKRNELSLEDRTHYLNIIYEETERITGLVDELFYLAKMDKNEFPVVIERIELSPFLHYVYEKVRPAFTDKNLNLELICEETLTIDSDPSRIEQVLFNILDNALKYSNKGTTTKIKAFRSKEFISISVTDQGIGIPKEELNFVFDRLYRVEKSRSRSTGGLGLGLAIVKQLMDVLDGSISVESKEGKGTCFTISFKENNE